MPDFVSLMEASKPKKVMYECFDCDEVFLLPDNKFRKTVCLECSGIICKVEAD